MLDAGITEHLQSPHVEEGSTRQGGATAQALNCQRRDAVLGQEHRRRQPDEAAASNEHGNFLIDGRDATHSSTFSHSPRLAGSSAPEVQNGTKP